MCDMYLVCHCTLCCAYFLTCMYLLYYYLLCFFFFFFKQKTAYEMRISDWSSDVCSSDLPFNVISVCPAPTRCPSRTSSVVITPACGACKIGRASCRERVCQYV